MHGTESTIFRYTWSKIQKKITGGNDPRMSWEDRKSHYKTYKKSLEHDTALQKKKKYGRITTRVFYYNIRKKQEQNNPCVKPILKNRYI